MSIHINANKEQVAKTVLMPGDPVRAGKIAFQFMEESHRFNGIRGMDGYTGISLHGKEFSIHPSGMGQPSLGIYVNELFLFYGVETIIRVGTFGSYQKNIPCGSIFIPDKATTDSNMNPSVVEAFPDQELFSQAISASKMLEIKFHSGHLFSTDTFYDLKQYKKGEKKDWEVMADKGVIGVEMESHTLFCLAKYYGRKALTLLVASDNLVTGEHMTAIERETSVNDMMAIALAII